jgi:hypothetical protein
LNVFACHVTEWVATDATGASRRTSTKTTTKELTENVIWIEATRETAWSTCTSSKSSWSWTYL